MVGIVYLDVRVVTVVVYGRVVLELERFVQILEDVANLCHRRHAGNHVVPRFHRDIGQVNEHHVKVGAPLWLDVDAIVVDFVVELVLLDEHDLARNRRVHRRANGTTAVNRAHDRPGITLPEATDELAGHPVVARGLLGGHAARAMRGDDLGIGRLRELRRDLVGVRIGCVMDEDFGQVLHRDGGVHRDAGTLRHDRRRQGGLRRRCRHHTSGLPRVRVARLREGIEHADHNHNDEHDDERDDDLGGYVRQLLAGTGTRTRRALDVGPAIEFGLAGLADGIDGVWLRLATGAIVVARVSTHGGGIAKARPVF